MTRITTTLVRLGCGLALALGFVALPLSAGAESTAALKSQYSQHRFFFSEEMLWRTLDEATAEYAMLAVSELERIAGRTNLDTETIHFLEDNLWVYDFRAAFVGAADANDVPEEARWFLAYEAQLREQAATTLGVYALDPDDYSDEIPWQDRVEPYAELAETTPKGFFPHQDDVPQLRHGEVNY